MLNRMERIRTRNDYERITTNGFNGYSPSVNSNCIYWVGLPPDIKNNNDCRPLPYWPSASNE